MTSLASRWRVSSAAPIAPTASAVPFNQSRRRRSRTNSRNSSKCAPSPDCPSARRIAAHAARMRTQKDVRDRGRRWRVVRAVEPALDDSSRSCVTELREPDLRLPPLVTRLCSVEAVQGAIDRLVAVDRSRTRADAGIVLGRLEFFGRVPRERPDLVLRMVDQLSQAALTSSERASKLLLAQYWIATSAPMSSCLLGASSKVAVSAGRRPLP